MWQQRKSRNPPGLLFWLWSAGRNIAHDPPKCERFGDKIMRYHNIWGAVGRKTGAHPRIKSEGMLLLIALDSCFDAFSSREPASTSLENASRT
jgi:hypothetical protein